MTSNWNAERTDRLKALWLASDKPSCSQIASIFHSEFGINITRNGIIGKVHRLGLERRGARGNYKGNGKAAKTVRQHRSRMPRPVYEAPPVAMPPCIVDPLNIKLTDAQSGQCRWIQGDDDLICGHPADGGSWCPYHHSVVFKKREVKQARRPVMRFAATEFV